MLRTLQPPLQPEDGPSEPTSHASLPEFESSRASPTQLKISITWHLHGAPLSSSVFEPKECRTHQITHHREGLINQVLLFSHTVLGKQAGAPRRGHLNLVGVRDKWKMCWTCHHRQRHVPCTSWANTAAFAGITAMPPTKCHFAKTLKAPAI